MTKSKNIQESYINIGDIKCQIIRQRIKNTYIHIKNSNVTKNNAINLPHQKKDNPLAIPKNKNPIKNGLKI